MVKCMDFSIKVIGTECTWHTPHAEVVHHSISFQVCLMTHNSHSQVCVWVLGLYIICAGVCVCVFSVHESVCSVYEHEHLLSVWCMCERDTATVLTRGTHGTENSRWLFGRTSSQTGVP